MCYTNTALQSISEVMWAAAHNKGTSVPPAVPTSSPPGALLEEHPLPLGKSERCPEQLLRVLFHL